MGANHTPNSAEILLGKHIERLRKQNNLTRLELGRKINKIEQHIAKYEAGGFVPLGVLEDIGNALGVPIEKRVIRRISKLRKLEMETKIEQGELSDLYTQALGEE